MSRQASRNFVQIHCFPDEAKSLVHCPAAEALSVLNELGGLATHAFLWWIADSEKLSTAALEDRWLRG